MKRRGVEVENRVQHVTNPENHEHRCFSIFVKSECKSTSELGNNGFRSCRSECTGRPPETLNPISPGALTSSYIAHRSKEPNVVVMKSCQKH